MKWFGPNLRSDIWFMLGLCVVMAKATDAVEIVGDDILTNEDRSECNVCHWVGFDVNNWIGGLGRVCDCCASDHFKKQR